MVTNKQKERYLEENGWTWKTLIQVTQTQEDKYCTGESKQG